MNTNGEDTQDGGPQRMQDFIFARELAEVYLLLDHLSGRSDRSLAEAIGGAEDNDGRTWIEKICAIGWPPKGTSVEQAAQAATLLMAKDKLNFTAKPANGASIAFTLLVAGDDDATLVRDPARGPFHWLRGLAFWRSAENSPKPEFAGGRGNPAPSISKRGVEADRSALPPVSVADNSPPKVSEGRGVDGRAGLPSGGFWGGEPPSRTSLARLAYPGLVSTAVRFNRQIRRVIFLLFIWLIFTCVLSWDIAAGHAILTRLDNVETARVAIQKRIADAEVEDVKRSGVTPKSDGTSADSGSPSKSEAGIKAKPVQRYCVQPAPAISPTGDTIEQFKDATQRQICELMAENRINYSIGREDIADWLAPWGWMKGISHWVCSGRCLTDPTVAVPDKAINQQQWAAVLLEVLATAVLPLCYGFLGAGAAVVRNIWGKMKDSLLSPRDLTLSLGQLALGAVIGACIGLFVTPSGAGAQGAAGLTAAVTLTPSAMSFIAGFGVEGVFVALESLIKRVFNIPDPKP